MATDAPRTRTALIWAMAEAIARERPFRCGTTRDDCTPHMGCTCYKQAVAALAAIEAAGCRVVPVQATLTMKEGSSVHFALEEVEYENIRPLWESMLNGSPYAPEAKNE